MWGRKRARSQGSFRGDSPTIERQDDGMWQGTDSRGRIVRNASLSVLVEELASIERNDHPAMFATASAEGVRVESHVTTDTQVMHCIFCGSGQVFARSDKTVECSICNRVFVAMEQPLYSAMPSTEYMGQEIGGAPPAAPAAPSFAPPPEAVQMDPNAPAPASPPVPGGGGEDASSEEEGDDPFPPKKTGLRTETGALLDPHSYVRHLASKFR